jgi:hypothetical protein
MIKNNINIEEVLKVNLTLPESSLGLEHQNNTFHFLLPIFKIQNIYGYPEYRGIYYKDKERNSTLDNCIYILLAESDNNKSLLAELKANDNFKYLYYAGYNNKDLICCVLQCDKEFIEDYNKLVEGKYSKVSNAYIELLKKYTFNKSNLDKLLGICQKNEEFKKTLEEMLDLNLDNQELWIKFEPEREIFKF